LPLAPAAATAAATAGGAGGAGAKQKPPMPQPRGKKLPQGWSQETDEEGKVYYHNEASGQSQWEFPSDTY